MQEFWIRAANDGSKADQEKFRRTVNARAMAFTDRTGLSSVSCRYINTYDFDRIIRGEHHELSRLIVNQLPYPSFGII